MNISDVYIFYSVADVTAIMKRESRCRSESMIRPGASWSQACLPETHECSAYQSGSW